MSRQRSTLERVHLLTDQEVVRPEAWLVAHQDLLQREKGLAYLSAQLRAERRMFECAKTAKECSADRRENMVTLTKLSVRPSELCHPARSRLVGLVGVSFIMAVGLLLQLHRVPDSSLSYSLISAVISLLFNFSSSALLRVFQSLSSLFDYRDGHILGLRQ